MSILLKRPGQSTFASDKSYLDTIANKNAELFEIEKAKEMLYLKYIPLVKKVALKFNLKYEDREDFESEAYLTMQKTLKFVDTKRIDEKFSFGYFYRFNLLNQGIKTLKKKLKMKEENVSFVSYDALLEKNSSALTGKTVTDEEVFRDLFTDQSLAIDILKKAPAEFMKERDKNILIAALRGTSVKDVARDFNLSEQRIKGICNSKKEILREMVR